MKTITALLACLLAVSSQAATLNNAPVAMTSGNWKVYRAVDPMTDAIKCTGVYKGNYGIQLSKEALFIQVRGGIETVAIRFGDNPPQATRLPTAMEKKIGLVILKNSDYDQVVGGERLRVQVYTTLRDVQENDLDLTGIKEAWESIASECPVQSAN